VYGQNSSVEKKAMTLEAENRRLCEKNEDSLARRGPLRPELLVSVRKHQDCRLAGLCFRAVDTIFLIAVTILFLKQIADRSTLETTVFDLLPAIASVCFTGFMLLTLGLYRFGRNERLYNHYIRVALALLVGASVAIVFHALVPATQVERADILRLISMIGIGVVFLHAVWWAFVVRWRSLGLLIPNIVVVGANSHTEEFISTTIDRGDMSILGVFDDRSDRSPLEMLGVPVLGTTDTMLRHRIMPCVDLIVVTIDQSATARVRQIMERLSKLPNAVTMYVDDADVSQRAAAIERIADAPLALLYPETDAVRKAFSKRVQDIFIGLIALLVFSIPMVLIALAIRIESSGPVFFRQNREGFNNEEFLVWKFRTMLHEAADQKAERQVTANDDRVTRVGRILRSTSLDELPQLFNVIVGEMSLVGPRPHAIGMKTGGVESSELVAEYAHRHRIKPGMTGWAAINGSRGPLHAPEEISRRVAFDIAYIERQSAIFDLQIMLRTIPSLLGDRAAIR